MIKKFAFFPLILVALLIQADPVVDQGPMSMPGGLVPAALMPVLNTLVDNPTCASLPRSQWQTWLDTSSYALSNSWALQSYDSSDPYALIKTCWNYLAAEKMTSCFENLKNYSFRKSSEFSIGHQLGFNSPDSDYLASRLPYSQLPDELKNGLPQNYEEVFKAKGWKSLLYRSRILANPRFNQYSRLLVFVPSPEYDRWIQFTMSDIEEIIPKQSILIDFISIVKMENGMALENPKINFTQYERDFNGQNPVQRPFLDKCIRCHPSGMRHLVPMPGSLENEEAFKTLISFNKKMDAYGAISWAGEIAPEKISPPFGARDGAHSCVECHNNFNGSNGQSREILTAFTDRSHFLHKMSIEYSMPTHLKQDPESKDLFGVLKLFKTLSKDLQKELFSLSKAPKNEVLVEFAASHSMIAENQKSAALAQNGVLKAKMEKVFEQQVSEFKDDLEIWLKGGKQNCLDIPPAPPASAPPMGLAQPL